MARSMTLFRDSFFLQAFRFFDSEKKGYLFLLILSLGLRLPAAFFPPPAWVYNMDEFSFLKSTLGMTFGLLPTELQWPAATLHFAFLPVIWLHFLISSPMIGRICSSLDFNGGLNALLLYLGQALYEPKFLLVNGRILLASFCAFTPLWIVWMLKNHLPKMEKWTVGLLFASSPMLIEETAVLKGDALGIMFWGISCYCFLRFLTSPLDLHGRKLFLAFLFLGLAVASRFNYGIAFPFFLIILGMKLIRERSSMKISYLQSGRRLLFLIAAFLFPLFIFFPFIWTHPLSTLKATLGSYLFLSYGIERISPRSVIFTSMMNQVGLPAMVLALFGGIMIWKQKGRWAGPLTLLLFLIFLIPLWRSRHVEARYTLPLLPILIYWAGSGVRALSNLSARRFPSGRNLFLAAIFLLAAGWNFWSFGQWFRNTHQPSSIIAVANWLKFHTRSADRLGLPNIFRPYIPPNGPALDEIIKNFERHPNWAIQRATQLQIKIESGKAVAPSPPDFALNFLMGEDEVLDLFCNRTMLLTAEGGKAPRSARYALYYQSQPEKPESFAKEKVTEMFQRGELDVLVTDAREPGLDPREYQPFVSQEPWLIYLHHSPERGRFVTAASSGSFHAPRAEWPPRHEE